MFIGSRPSHGRVPGLPFNGTRDYWCMLFGQVFFMMQFRIIHARCVEESQVAAIAACRFSPLCGDAYDS